MRQDLAKLMVERPRGGARIRIHRSKGNQKSAWIDGDGPRRESMSRSRGTKWLSEYFAPLIRILRSQRGVLWDDVYSEIATQIQPTNVVQKHVLDHLFDFVIDETWVESGRPYGRLYGDESIRLDRPSTRYDLFYVCPKTRRLKEVPYRPSRRPTEGTSDVLWFDPRTQLRRIEEIWYAFSLEVVPANIAARRSLSDCFLKRTLEELAGGERGRRRLVAAYGFDGIYAAGKRQLGKKELREIGRRKKSAKKK